jgi:hypothetical protein
MKKICLLVALLSLLLGFNQTASRSNTSEVASLKAFLTEFEKSQIRFINGDPTLWKKYCSRS